MNHELWLSPRQIVEHLKSLVKQVVKVDLVKSLRLDKV
jgi:hypothetical protein